MKEPEWLNREDVIAIHEQMLALHGGLAGIRDQGLLDSALAKPKNKFAYGSRKLPGLAASYAAGIIHNHPFLDGNERTGFMLAAAFLEINGQEFFATEEEVLEWTLALAASSTTEQGYAAWLRKNSRVST